jgi:NAD+ diphosphatase
MDYAFAFQAGALERAAHLRMRDPGRADPRTRALVFWRGKLLAGADGRPVKVALDNAALVDQRDPPIFVGLTPDGPLFATDLVLWTPPEDATTIGEFTDQSQQKHPGFPAATFS